MKNWEEKYKQLKSGELDKKLKELQEKVETRNVTKEQYLEYQKYSVIKENMSKIENVLQYRDLLKQKIKKIDAILEKRNEIKEKEESISKEKEEYNNMKESFIELELQMNTLIMEKEALTKELKNNNIQEDRKQEIMVKLSELEEKINDNNSEYVIKTKMVQDKKQNISKQENVLEQSKKQIEKFEKFNEEEIEKNKMKLSQRISKCNMVAKNLLNGRSWDYIDMTLDNWQNRRFTSKTKLSDLGEKIQAKQGQEQIQIKPKQETDLQKVSDFDMKYPRLAKIKNWFKSRFIKEKPQTIVENKVEEKEDKEKQKDIITNENEEFKKFIKEIAEKGIKGIEEEKTEKAKQAAKNRFAENKKAAHQRETEKFGKEYADKSINPNEIIESEER